MCDVILIHKQITLHSMVRAKRVKHVCHAFNIFTDEWFLANYLLPPSVYKGAPLAEEEKKTNWKCFKRGFKRVVLLRVQ